MKKNHIRYSIVRCFIVALLISHTFLLQGCWFKGDKKMEENNTIESLAVADIIDMDDIEELISAGKITVSFGEHNLIRSIDGQFTDKPLNSVEDAVRIFNSVCALFGESYITHKNGMKEQKAIDEVYYKKNATFNGISILGSQIILSAKDGKATGLYITYDKKVEDVDTKPTITEEEAKEIAYDDYFTKYLGGRKCKDYDMEAVLWISTSKEEPFLVWHVYITNDDKNCPYFTASQVQYSIVANGQNAGDILGSDNGVRSVSQTPIQ